MGRIIFGLPCQPRSVVCGMFNVIDARALCRGSEITGGGDADYVAITECASC